MQAEETRFGPITGLLVRTFAAQPKDAADRRAAYGQLEGWVSIVLNTALFAFKLVLGLVSGSISVMADAAHTLSDSVTSGVVIVAARVARRPPDREHPFGHGRAEAVATVAIAVLLAAAGLEFGKASVERLLSPSPTTGSWWVAAGLALSVLVKEWMCRFAQALARRSGNEALAADAWHHRSDALSTILVVFAVIGSRWGWTWLDGVMGLGVSVMLVKVGYDVVKGAVDTLLGSRPTPAELAEVRRQAMEVEGVEGVHDVVIHRYGETRFVSLHIETTDKLSPLAIHDLAEAVEARVATGGHGSVAVHMDPVDRDHPEYAAVRALVEAQVAQDPGVESFHDLRLIGGPQRFNVVLDLSLKAGCSARESCTEGLRRAIQSRYPAVDVIIEVDPLYSYSSIGG